MASWPLLTRSGVDWTVKYPTIVAAPDKLNIKSAHAVVSCAALMQTASQLTQTKVRGFISSTMLSIFCLLTCGAAV